MTLQPYRARILQTLYEERAKDTLQTLDSEDLAQRMRLPWDEIRQDVIYLQEKGYLILKNRQLGRRIFCSLYLTAKGIDFVEKEELDEVEILRGQLTQRYSNLQYLQEQAATYGAGQVPLHLYNQINLERQAIEYLEAKLGELKEI